MEISNHNPSSCLSNSSWFPTQCHFHTCKVRHTHQQYVHIRGHTYMITIINSSASTRIQTPTHPHTLALTHTRTHTHSHTHLHTSHTHTNSHARFPCFPFSSQWRGILFDGAFDGNWLERGGLGGGNLINRSQSQLSWKDAAIQLLNEARPSRFLA